MSDREYNPDLWEIVKITSPKGDYYRVLGSWYGGFAGSNSWRMSSGITEIIDHDNHYEVLNESGSTYICRKHDRGMSGYTTSIYAQYKESARDGMDIDIVEIDEVKL